MGDSLFFGSGDYIYAINKKNGILIWEYKTGSVVHSTPAFYKGSVIVGSFDGYVYSLNRSSGSLLWKFKSVGQRFFPKGEMQGSPVIYKDLLFVGSRDFNFYALDAPKGTGIWNKYFTRGWAMGKPVIHENTLYVGTSDDKLLVAFDPDNGNIKWQSDIKFNMFGSAAFSANLIYIGTLMGRIYALEKQTGKILWTINNPLFEQNKLRYLKADETYRDDIGSVFKKNDDILNMYYDFGAIFSTPVLYNGFMFVTSTDGTIYAYKQ
jgi:outer membrane protein assembly factor BamB